MNLKQLETFYHFCRFRNMSRTAEHLFVTQSAISQQLRSFEAEAGVKLFFREANEYYLTETGEVLYLLSRGIFSRLGQMEGLLEEARKVASERLRIGTTKDYARTLMPDLIARFQEKYPHVQVHLSEGNSAELLAKLRTRKEDLVVVARSEYDSALRAIPFARALFTLVARPDHPLAVKSPVSISDLTGESMIIREQGSGLRNAVLEKLRQFGVKPSMLVESESLSFILAYVERRKGVSFILTREVEKELAEGVLKEIILTEGSIGFESDVVIRREEPLSIPMQYFLTIATDGRANELLHEGVERSDDLR
ncbi:MAG TPA: LysR family transcriptional regulator [Desulfomonilaceae bacterium]|nr:LysR family transcriptional regulator [Desulfomonilaceae bacterium]